MPPERTGRKDKKEARTGTRKAPTRSGRALSECRTTCGAGSAGERNHADARRATRRASPPRIVARAKDRPGPSIPRPQPAGRSTRVRATGPMEASVALAQRWPITVMPGPFPNESPRRRRPSRRPSAGIAAPAFPAGDPCMTKNSFGPAPRNAANGKPRGRSMTSRAAPMRRSTALPPARTVRSGARKPVPPRCPEPPPAPRDDCRARGRETVSGTGHGGRKQRQRPEAPAYAARPSGQCRPSASEMV